MQRIYETKVLHLLLKYATTTLGVIYVQCKVGVFSIGLLEQSIRQVVNALGLEDCFFFSDIDLFDGMSLPTELNEAEVLVSSGVRGSILKKLTNKPVIIIEPSVYDILYAYSQAVAIDPQPVIIYPLHEYSSLVEELRTILSVDIKSVVYMNLEELDSIILELMGTGTQCIIGSGLACTEAEKFGLKSIFLYPKESLKSYVTLAYDTASSIHSKDVEYKFLSLALDNVKDGLLFTDETGRILVCNPTAKSIFSGDGFSDIAGKKITDLSDNCDIAELFRSFTPVKNILADFCGEKYIFSAYPIYIRNTPTNAVLSFYNINTIQTQERRIRNALVNRRYVSRFTFDDVRSGNSSYNCVLERAKNYAKHDKNVLIFGPSGSSKAVLAQAIHSASSRSDYPFVFVNCNAASDDSIESELFGYEEIPYAGGKRTIHQGLMEIAHGGTIFFDDIAALSQMVQSKLVRSLQEEQVTHLNSKKTIPCNVRVIAATTRNLWTLVCEHRFNESLYYCLSVLNLIVPCLSAHAEDILPLFLEFTKKLDPVLASRYYELSDKLEPVLTGYSWPGNVRELENFAYQIFAIVSPYDKESELLSCITEELVRRGGVRTPPQSSAEPHTEAANISELLSEDERIMRALEITGGNCTKASEILGINRTTLWRKLKRMQHS